MPLDNLKNLKQKIDANFHTLAAKYPFTPSLLRSIELLLADDPTQIKVKLWIEGCIDMIVELEKQLYYIENEKNTLSKNRLRFLKKYMKKHQNSLKDKFPQIETFLNAIDVLLKFQELSPLEKPWLKGVDKILIEIEKEFISLEYLKN